jgi:very-short-patch-repair endonuclease
MTMAERWQHPTAAMLAGLKRTAKANKNNKKLSIAIKNSWTSKRKREASEHMKELCENPTLKMLVGYRKISKSMKRNWEHPTLAMKRAVKNLASNAGVYWKRKSYREKQSASWTDERRKAFSKQQKDLLKDPDFVKRFHASHGGASHPQRATLRRMCRVGISGFKLEVPFEEFCLDIANEELKMAIEIDGPYWHRTKRTYLRLRRKRRVLRSLGWKFLRIRLVHNEVGENSFERILNFVRQKRNGK